MIARLERPLIALVAAHSVILGAAMLARPIPILRLLGWNYEGPPFFPAQSGLFLIILGGAYLAAIWKRPFAWFLMASKAAASVFLLVTWGFGIAPTVILWAGLLDFSMGMAVAVVCVTAQRSEPVSSMTGGNGGR